MSTNSSVLLGIISDTHGHVHNTQAAVRMLESLQVDLVIHCGDVGDVTIPPLLQKWPTHYVFGNVDRDRDELRAAMKASRHQCHDRFCDLTLADKRIAVLHSDDAQLFDQTVRGGLYDLVCYGHTHQAEQHQVGKTLVLNPGAVYRANPHSIAVVEVPAMRATIVPF